MPKKLSAVALATLKPGEYRDSLQPGLVLRVGSRRRTWQLRHRIAGKERRVPLGFFPAMSLAEARQAARDIGLRVDAGGAAPPPPVHPRAALTLGALIDRYQSVRQSENHRVKTLKRSMQALRHGLRDLLDTPASAITKQDLRAARDRIGETAPMAANRLLSYAGPLLQWAAEEDIIASNPVRDIRRAPERRRERTLNTSELRAIWAAAGEMDGEVGATFGKMVKFLLCTGQRRSEAGNLRHGDILDHVWRQRDNKSSRPHSLRLPPLALEQIGHGAAHDLCFPGETGGPIAGFSKLKSKLDLLSGVRGWRLHDLRRTCASNLQELGVNNDVVSGVLNHSLLGVQAVYLRGALEEAKAQALLTWTNYLQREIADKAMRLPAL